MNAVRLAQNTELDPLVEAANAEGFNFMARLQLELNKGDFERVGTALYGVLGDELVGVGGLTSDPYPDAEPSVGRLRHLYVLPCYRRQGSGQLLVSTVIEAVEPHYHVLRLRTTTPGAARFYDRLGFSGCTDPNATQHYLNLK